MLELLWLTATMAATNRMRGGGCPFVSALPGHARLYAAALVAAFSFLAVGLIDAVAVAVCYLLWSLLPWGRWYSLGKLEGDPDRPPSQFELILARITEEDAVAFTIRNLVALIPAAVLLHPAFILLAFFQTAAYGIGWKWQPTAPIRLAEYLTGAIWGVFIWAFL